jgi:adenylyltransferase/sulfurtransferase
MNNHELLRYSRQILLPDIDIAGQEKLLSSKVLIMGLGGLGAPVALYLASAGIGTLCLADFDHVDLTNLQRQIIHTEQSIGCSKPLSAEQSLRAINPSINYELFENKLNKEELLRLVYSCNLVIDCTDNFDTRFLLNEVCFTCKTPLISGAVIRMEGQITTYDFRNLEQACYRCLYAEEGEIEDTCSTTGVLAPVAGIIGSMQATEAIKTLLDLPTLAGRLQILDAKYMQWRNIKLRKDPECPVCSAPIIV